MPEVLANLGINFGTGVNAGQFPLVGSGGQGQSFQTIPLSNQNLVLYQLSIRDFNPPYSAQYGYTFPLSPTSVTKEFTALTNIYDVADLVAENGGVQRIVDPYGSTLPSFSLEGTTGWQFHGTDGFAFSGLQSIAAVQSLLTQYAQLNRAQQLANKPLYPLEYYDFFSSEFWQVVPIGPQTVRQTSVRPLLFEYAFKLAAVGPPVGGGNSGSQSQNDDVGNQFDIPGQQGISNLNGNINSFLSGYE